MTLNVHPRVRSSMPRPIQYPKVGTSTKSRPATPPNRLPPRGFTEPSRINSVSTVTALASPVRESTSVRRKLQSAIRPSPTGPTSSSGSILFGTPTSLTSRRTRPRARQPQSHGWKQQASRVRAHSQDQDHRRQRDDFPHVRRLLDQAPDHQQRQRAEPAPRRRGGGSRRESARDRRRARSRGYRRSDVEQPPVGSQHCIDRSVPGECRRAAASRATQPQTELGVNRQCEQSLCDVAGRPVDEETCLTVDDELLDHRSPELPRPAS